MYYSTGTKGGGAVCRLDCGYMNGKSCLTLVTETNLTKLSLKCYKFGGFVCHSVASMTHNYIIFKN